MSYSTREQFLALLMRAGGNFISGEEASRNMGISRAAVSTAVRGLRDEGYSIDSVTNRGYRLSVLPDALNNGTLLSGLTPERMDRVICLTSTSSTNSYLMEMAQEDAPDGQVVIAEAQTAGRGRTGKRFASPDGLGIYLSYLIRPDISAGESALVTDWHSITRCVARSVCDVIKDLTNVSPKVSGNGLFVNGKKLCGILTQTDMEMESGMFRALVVGIGINVHQTAEDLAPDSEMTSLDLETGTANSRPTLTSSLIHALDTLRVSGDGSR